jgi:hypothetical protein
LCFIVSLPAEQYIAQTGNAVLQRFYVRLFYKREQRMALHLALLPERLGKQTGLRNVERKRVKERLTCCLLVLVRLPMSK